jgi:hypothetical protein
MITSFFARALFASVVGAGGLSRAQAAAATPSITFKKQTVDGKFYAESIAAADINQDGNPDLVVGPLWWAGPAFTKRTELRAPHAYDKESYSDAFISDAADMDGDGLPDAIQIGWPGRPAHWLKNPGKAGGDWARFLIHPYVGTESPHFVKLLAGQPDVIIFSAYKKIGYATRQPGKPEAPWSFRAISAEGEWQRYTHGIGAGDINGDGRADLLTYNGWWEQPASLAGDPLWKFHAADFGKGGAQMYVYDVNADGRADVITSIEAHKYGVSWFEQLPPAAGSRPRWPPAPPSRSSVRSSPPRAAIPASSTIPAGRSRRTRTSSSAFPRPSRRSPRARTFPSPSSSRTPTCSCSTSRRDWWCIPPPATRPGPWSMH